MGSRPMVFASNSQGRIGACDDLPFEEMIRFGRVKTDHIRWIIMLEELQVHLVNLRIVDDGNRDFSLGPTVVASDQVDCLLDPNLRKLDSTGGELDFDFDGHVRRVLKSELIKRVEFNDLEAFSDSAIWDRVGTIGVVGILPKRVKIGKNLSIPDWDCRNIVCIRNPARLVECGGPRSTDTSRLGSGMESHQNRLLNAKSPCSLLADRFAGAEVLSEWLQSAVVPA